MYCKYECLKLGFVIISEITEHVKKSYKLKYCCSADTFLFSSHISTRWLVLAFFYQATFHPTYFLFLFLGIVYIQLEAQTANRSKQTSRLFERKGL